jgi:glucokinase
VRGAYPLSAVVGVDVGGTTISAGIVARDGTVLASAMAPTHREGPETAGRTLVDLVERMLGRASAQRLTVEGIGVGVPGLVDPVTGLIGDAHHAGDLTGQRLSRTLGARFGVAAFVDNDVNALALGEWMFGLGRGARSLVVLAAGTGLGGGIVLEGRLVRGRVGVAGELGHAPVKFDGRPCWCGGRGCLAVYASGRGIAEAAQRRIAGRVDATLLRAAGGDPSGITAPLVFGSAAGGDPDAVAVVEEACRALGAMIGTIVNGLNPEVVVVTGGVAVAYAALEASVREAAARHAFAAALAQTRIAIVPGDKRTSLRGAAALAFYEAAERAR